MDNKPHMGKVKLTHYLCRIAKRDWGTYNLVESHRRRKVLVQREYEQIMNEK